MGLNFRESSQSASEIIFAVSNIRDRKLMGAQCGVHRIDAC